MRPTTQITRTIAIKYRICDLSARPMMAGTMTDKATMLICGVFV